MLALQPSKALRPSRFSKWSSWDANAEQMIFRHRLNSVPRENATQQNDRPPREFTNALPKSAACCLAAKSAVRQNARNPHPTGAS
jgi:hypothetical protein